MNLMNFRYDLINYLIKKYNYNSYIEIGLNHPHECFDFVKCNKKHSVEPGYKELEKNHATYKFTSDEFFSRLNYNVLDISKDYKWDIIFIDGLHISYQVERDIINSLEHLSENGTIVLHDCDPFMYDLNPMRVLEDYYGYDWNGTVWKAFYKLRTEKTDLKMCCLNIDNGLGIIRRGNSQIIPHDNIFYEYKVFNTKKEYYLNLIDQKQLEKWLE
jgi:hypothetical protein